MQLTTTPKLFPPLALLTHGTGRLPQAPFSPRTGTLSPLELRRIVADLIG